jgi:hypothetical protein
LAIPASTKEGATRGGARAKNLAERLCWRSWIERARARSRSADPDSRVMAAHTKMDVGYNVQLAVGAKHKMLVEQAVINQVVDMGLLTEIADPAREILGAKRSRCRLPLLQCRGHGVRQSQGPSSLLATGLHERDARRRRQVAQNRAVAAGVSLYLICI